MTQAQLRPITDHPETAVKGDLTDLSPLILGGAPFNSQYNDNPENLSIGKIILESFQFGINAIDTSPYYGPSEILLGDSLKELLKDGSIKRENYYLFTKVGRIKLNDFDYSPEWIHKSIARSMDRLGTSYLDVVHLHDVEFIEEESVIIALRELKKIKDSGLIKYFGLSGYPVDFLYKIALRCVSDPEIGPLDSVLSYCNANLQNTTLLNYYDKFIRDCKLKLMNNSSILSMGMLRSQETRPFHPASPELKNKVQELAQLVKFKYKAELADIATRFAFKHWLGKQGITIIGVSNLYELEDALIQYWNVVEGKFPDDDLVFKEAQDFLEEHFNETWESGIEHK